MYKVATTLLLLTLAQAGFCQKGKRVTYPAFLRHVLSQQTSAAQKSTATKDRLIASSGRQDNGTTYDLIDTLHYTYSGTRGSTLSAADDDYSYSYFDNCNSFIRFGLEDPTTATLAYDTGYFYTPSIGGGAAFKMLKTYDAAGYLITLRAAGGAGQPQSFMQYSYDATHHCTRIIQMSDTSAAMSGKYAPTGLARFMTYTGGLLTRDSSYDFSSWEPDHKYTYTNNAAGKQTLVLGQIWSGTAWQNESRYTATYDASNRLSTAINTDWQMGAWLNQDKDSFGYPGTLATYNYKLHSGWDGTTNTFMKASLQTAKLTSFGAMDTLFVFGYSGGAPVLGGCNAFAYNAYQHLTSSLEYNYTGSGYASRPLSKVYFYYQTYNTTGIAGTEEKANNMLIYPNPANGDVLQIRFKAAPAANSLIRIIDATGRQVSVINASVTGEASIPVKELSAGIYYVEVRSNNSMDRTRFIKQ